MSIFKPPPNERPAPRPEVPPVADSTPSVIGAGMRILGDVESSGALKIEGTVEGSIRGGRQVVVARTGSVQGDIHAEEVVLAGRVTGTINAAERVEIQGTCRLEGDINTRSIVVLEGGVINGTVRMEDGSPRGTLLGTGRATPATP